VAVFPEVRRVLRAKAPFAVSSFNRCFPTKAVATWQALDGPSLHLRRAGFERLEQRGRAPRHTRTWR
jgi:hypothetical protein